ncbi:uncharacterized protein LOC130997957 [Salvia miltiorrhiza]|uniref:uncharacterized protein LOC130997957 n=1 Tax=Salvia miltiorrhiza TaxID=226208 RepID=UPI0025AD28ED|nr:uncharacterized protein LOC130997957 [Salvia miltiorrhiza]
MGEKPPLLHELLKEDQEPFHLKTYIANKQSQLKTSTTTLSLRKRRPIFHDAPTKRTNLCFLSFTASPDVRRSPFLDLSSPVKSPPNAAVFLHIPSRTATILVEAAMRIQKHQHSKPRTGFGLLGSFLKRLKDRSKNRKRAIGDKACSCSNRSADWAEDKSPPSTSSRVMEDICISDEDCTTPFRFSLHQSPSSTTPEFCSPAASPSRRLKQEKENSDNLQGDEEEEEEKEQCSPVSVLDPPFDEDDERESGGADDEEDYDMECSYENVQRAKQQLLHRLRRFEKLAELDPVELEKKLMVEGSDDEGHVERGESEGDGPLSADMKRLVSDLIVEEKKRMVQSGGSEVVMGRICNRLDSWKEVEFDTIDMMIGLDFKKEADRWSKHGQQVQETAAEIEVAIYLLLIQELTDELLI